MAKKSKFNWSKMTDKIKAGEAKGGFKKNVDERLYIPKVKDDGTFEALIRFIPQKNVDELPFTKTYSHGFQGSGGWFINPCPTTIGKDCPVCKANSTAWKEGDEDTARQRARRLSVYSNILVLKDPQNPSNEGKVFLYRYGVKIHDKIMGKIDVAEGSIDDPVMVFCPETGADFKLNIKQTLAGAKKFPNYDASVFREPSALTEEQQEIAEKNAYDLSEFTADKQYKDYAELEELFLKKIGEDRVLKQAEPPKEQAKEEEEEAPSFGASEEENDDFFKSLKD